MNAEFKKWLIADMANADHEAKQSFLRMLKFEPDKVAEIVSANLMHWGTYFVAETGTIIGGYNDEEDAQELVQAYKEHFAKEMATIPETPATIPK